jgi:hypothetical protein
MSFDVELKGIEQADTTGVQVPEYDPLLIAAGLAVASAGGPPITSQTYTPDSDVGVTAAKAVSVYAYQDGLLYAMDNARVDFTINLTAGAAGVISFNVTGDYNEPTDTALPAALRRNDRPGNLGRGRLLQLRRDRYLLSPELHLYHRQYDQSPNLCER